MDAPVERVMLNSYLLYISDSIILCEMFRTTINDSMCQTPDLVTQSGLCNALSHCCVFLTCLFMKVLKFVSFSNGTDSACFITKR
jgi:hypothetical protein